MPWYGQCVLAARMKSLSLAAQRFHKGTSAIDKIISEVATEHFADILRTISDLTQTYEELHSYRFTDDSDLRVRVNITGERLALYESLENDTRLSKTEHRRLKELYRKIASVAHPDKGGDPEVFTLATYLYTAKDIKGLFLLWISEVEPDASHDWEKRIAFLDNAIDRFDERQAKLNAGFAFKVLQAHITGNYELKKQRVKELLMLKLSKLTEATLNVKVR